MPYSRADVEVWPDEEEVASQRTAAMHAVDACMSSGDIDMSAAMQTVDAAAMAAAIGWSQVHSIPYAYTNCLAQHGATQLTVT